MNKATQRFLGFVFSFLLLALLGYLLLGSPSARLPDPIAIQWGLSGKATNCVPLRIFRILALGTSLLLFGLQLRDLVFQALKGAPSETDGNLKIPATCISLNAVMLAVVWSNLDAPNWQLAQLSWPALIAALSLGISVSSYAKRDPQQGISPKPKLGLGSDEKATWLKQVHAPKPMWIGATSIMVLLLVFGDSGLGAYLRFVLGVTALVSMAWIRVQVSGKGLQVFYGFWPVAFTQIPLCEIKGASVENLDGPAYARSWGYRGSLRLFKKATIFIRRGATLRLDLTRGRVLRITVDDAGTAAGLLNDLCERQRA